VATTAHNIQTHQLLYRSGLAAHLVVTLTNVPLALIFYELFKVNRRLALLTAFFILVATAIEPLASSTSSHRWPFWAARPLPAPCDRHSLRRWHPCPALCRMAATTCTPCSSA
jgi:Domain of unknown function (DUF4386)